MIDEISNKQAKADERIGRFPNNDVLEILFIKYVYTRIYMCLFFNKTI